MARVSRDVLTTGTFWLSLFGLSAAARGQRKLGGAALFVVWAGHLGIIWERFNRASLRGLRNGDRHALELDQLLAHALLGAIGWRYITR